MPADIVSGTHARTLPVPVASSNLNGGIVGMYGERDWFDRLHVLPATLDLGSIRTTAIEQIRLYNAGRQADTINTVDAAGGAGITLNNPATPYNLAAKTSALYDVTVLLNTGPQKIDASIDFNGNTTGLLLIVGTRLIAKIWPVTPDWSQPVIEIFQWRTDVQRARDGSEFRRAVFRNLRRGMRFRILVDDSEIAAVDRLLSGWQSRLFNVPRWQDKTRLTAAAAAGATSLSFDTSIGEWRSDAQVVLLGPNGEREAPVVQGVNVGSVDLTDPLENDWPAGTRVYPSRLMRLPREISFERKAAGILIGEAEFIADTDTVTTYSADDADTLFEGLPVYLVEPNRVTNAPAGYSRDINVIDNGVAPMLVDDPDNQPVHSHQWQYDWFTRTESDAFIAWLFARQGRLNEFWFPTWSKDMNVAAAIQVDDPLLRIDPIEWDEFYSGRRNRDVIALQATGGTWRFARIISAEIIAGQEHLTLDQPLVNSPDPQLEVNQVRRVCFLEKMRLGADSVEVVWTTNSTTRIGLSFRSLP